MGLYGNMLSYHPGQFREFTYFDMTPGTNSGYTINPNVPVSTIRGVLQNSTSKVADSNGNLVDINDERLWTNTILIRGYFVQFQDITYRIVDGNDWPFEGGFYLYTLERVVGDNGTPDTGTYTTGLGGTPL
jgi:hypothetical protein